jgi:predicted small lipoprotein YifL
MRLRVVAAGLIPLTLLGCGVKTSLERPMDQIVQQQNQQQNPINPRKDPSRPPIPLGEPGGTTQPYPTGP